MKIEKADVKITDSPAQAADYAKRNIPYIVILNEKNRAEAFPSRAYCVENAADIDDAYKDRVYRRFRGLSWDIAETKRLKIREITVSDVPRLYELYSDERVTRYMEPLFPEMEKELEYTKAYIENVYKFYGYGMWVIALKESGELIGRVGLEYKEGFDGLELGFMLGTAYQHKGYAYEACEAVLRYGRDALGVNSFCAFVNEDNTASVRLCERLGFVKAGKVMIPALDFDDKNTVDKNFENNNFANKNFVNKITEKEFVHYVYRA